MITTSLPSAPSLLVCSDYFPNALVRLALTFQSHERQRQYNQAFHIAHSQMFARAAPTLLTSIFK